MIFSMKAIFLANITLLCSTTLHILRNGGNKVNIKDAKNER
jgi:hypothetical protein